MLKAETCIKTHFFWGLKVFPLRRGNPATKDHLNSWLDETTGKIVVIAKAEVVLSSLDLHTAVKFFKPQKK